MNFKRNKKAPPDSAEHPNAAAAEADAAPQKTPAEDSAASAEPAELSPEEVAELKAKALECDEWKSRCMYTAAELENFRKRMARERKELLDYAGQNILFDVLDVIDNFERALEADKKESDPKVIVKGIEMIFSQLLKLLEKHGVKPVPAKGEAFNPEIHEAIQKLPVPDCEPGTVVEELQKGYTYRQRTLRPARVVVASEADQSAGD